MNKHILTNHHKTAGRGLISLMALILVLIIAGPAAAGGWAVINLDAVPAGVTAGDPLHLEFTVLQHGKTPVHVVYEDYVVAPFLIATNADTGETVRVEAAPAKEIGRFTLDVTFPSAGTWEWTITPDPLIGETTFAPLTVTEAATPLAAASAENALWSSSSTLSAVGIRLILAIAGVAFLILGFRAWRANQKETVPVPSSSSSIQ